MASKQSKNIQRLQSRTGLPKKVGILFDDGKKSYESTPHHGNGSPDLVSTPDNSLIFDDRSPIMTIKHGVYPDYTYSWYCGTPLNNLTAKTAIRIKFMPQAYTSAIRIRKMSIGLRNTAGGTLDSINHTPVTVNGERSFDILSPNESPDGYFSDWIDVSKFTDNEFGGSVSLPVLIKFEVESFAGVYYSNAAVIGTNLYRSDQGLDLVDEDVWAGSTTIIVGSYNSFIASIEVKNFGEIDDIYTDTLNDTFWKKDGNPSNNGWALMGVGADTLVALTDTNISSGDIIFNATDTLNWTGSTGMTWGGAQWDVTSIPQDLTPDTWRLGFRPDYVRITHNDSTPGYFRLFDNLERYIVDAPNVVSGQLYPINWLGEDIWNLDLSLNINSSVTKIEFITNAAGTQPNEGDILVADNAGIWYNTNAIPTLNVTNAVTAGSFVGDGSGLTNLSATTTLVELTDTAIVGDGIFNATDTINWGSVNGATWDGTLWTTTTGYPRFNAGAWTVGARPDYIRITHNDPAPGSLSILDIFGNQIVNEPVVVSGQKYLINWAFLQDIGKVDLVLAIGSFITNIEFITSGTGTQPNEGDILVADASGVWHNTDTIPTLNVTNAVTAGSFVGDGSGLTGLPASGVPRNVSNIVAAGTESGVFVQPSITTSINNIDVWVNGIKLIRTSEFTSDGTNITILNPVIIALDDIEIITWE